MPYQIPGMFLFLEPAGLQIGALFALSLACGIGYEALNRRFQENVRLVFAIVSCVAIGLECWPLFSGSMFREPSPTWASLPSAYVKVPDDWLALRSEMLNRASSNSILLLPPNKDYQSEYTWGYHGVDLVAMDMVPQSVLMPGSSVNYTQDRRTLALSNQLVGLLFANDRHFTEAIRMLGIRYVLLRNDIVARGFPFEPSIYERAIARECGRPHCILRTIGDL